MYFVYILYSETANKYYVGQTDNIIERMRSHKEGISPYTSRAKDWKLLYNEIFETRSEALIREKEIKRKKSRKYIEWLILKNQ